MPWWHNIIPESIKKNVLAYLLERYLGQFMEEKVSKDQLKVNLWEGTGTIEKITLDIQALNELGETQNWPVEFVDGYIEQVQLNLPWASILKESSFINIKGLKITVQPKQRHESASSMFESMWNSMTTSMQLPEELIKQDTSSEHPTQSYEGLELFEKTIDSIMGRIKVKFVETVFQIEHVPKDSSTGVGVVIEIDLFEYSDEVCTDPKKEEATKSKNEEPKSENNSPFHSSTKKNFSMQGVTLSTVEFLSESRTFSRSVLVPQPQHDEETDLVTGMLEKCDPNEDDESEILEDCVAEQQKIIEFQPELNEHRHVIKFGILSGSQQVSVLFNDTGNADGAKVSMYMTFGSFIMFLSPRQFHILKELANGLASPDIEDTSNVAPRTKCAAKPMSGLDFQRVEQELQNQLQPLLNLRLPGLRGTQGWSRADFDESDTEERFLPVKNTVSSMYDSTVSEVSSSMDSSVSSSMASSVTEYTNRSRRRSKADSDPSGEISHFQVRLESLALILLQEDLLFQPVESDQLLVPSSVQQMHQTVEKFFSILEDSIHIFKENVNFVTAKNILERACTLNHLRLLAVSVQIDGDEKTTNSAFSVTADSTISKFEIFECLFNPSNGAAEMIPILKFSESTPQKIADVVESNVTVKLKHVEKTSKHATRNNAGSRNDISIILKKCEMDLDITIIDRVTALLVSPNLCVVEKSRCNPWAASTMPELPTFTVTETRSDLKISSADLNIKLRFPIPDFRPAHDMNRIPWWKRNIRTDYLSLVLTDVVFQTTFQTNQAFKEYEIQSKGMQIYYMENERSSPLHIAKSEFDHKHSSSMEDFLYQIRLSIKIFPAEASDLEELDEPELDPMTTSCYGAFLNQRCEQPGPFSAKKVVHESDTPHYKLQNGKSAELIIPGNKHELDEFIKSTSSNTKTLVEVFIPLISLQFASKHIYEIIYNRINNDLLLWTPSAPKHKTNVFDHATYSSLCPGGKNFMNEAYDRFTMCKSGIAYEPGNDDDNDESEQGSAFYSTFGQSTMETQMKQPTILSTENKEQSKFVLNIQIAQGVFCVNPPARDAATNIIPGQQGELLLKLEDANLFIVNGYKGDDNLGYVCVQLHNAQLNHCDMISTPSRIAPLKEFGKMIGKHLNPTVYMSERGMLTNARNMGGDREMFTVAVKIKASHETDVGKAVQVSIGVSKGTLKHRMVREPNSWLSHLLDFFNIQDYPIPNYHVKENVTEVHMHLWDCAIDYRPRHFPVRSAVTIGNFSMSSHVTAPLNTTTLSFIFEECGLFLSEIAPPRNGVVSMIPVDLKRDYVNVIDLGIFELSLKNDEKKSAPDDPIYDLRASNNVFNIHTCSDSGKVLMEFLAYLAIDGDLTPPPTISEGSFCNPVRHAEQELIVVEPQHISYLTERQHERVKTLLEDAMKEDDVVEDAKNKSTRRAKTRTPGTKNKYTNRGTSFTQVDSVTSDLDDFCVIAGTEAGLEFFPKSGYPEVKWLSNDPVRIVDDHFEAPANKVDPLSQPKSFPTPLSRYTLCDMSIVWNMYGGNDFSLPEVGRKKKTVNFPDSNLSGAVSFSKTEQGKVMFANNPRTDDSSWLVKGGLNRDLNLHMEIHLKKIRFRHEVYPDTTTQASRQVFVVSDVEIVDRLESSQINKFLYQYFSRSQPKRSNANMIVIKALHMRPDLRLPRQECCLKLSMLPLRFNIDQDALLFLIRFFTELGNGPSKSDEFSSFSKNSTPTYHPPIMTVSEDEWTQQALKVVDENLIMLESKIQLDSNDTPVTASSGASDDSPIFFRDVTFTSEVPIKLDYHGKRVDMTHGSLPGLLMGLAQLNCSELKLKRLRHRKGLLGVDKLINYFLQEWLNDIKKNQLPSILSGIGPMYSVIQLLQGVRDLIWLPIEQYQKDGRIIKGLQRGANSFTTSTAMAALELTSRIINLIQITAETAYDIISPGPSVRSISRTKGKKKRYHNQPQDVREGMANAIWLLREGIGETAGNIVQVAAQEKEQKGYSGAVGGVIRQIPPTILKPIIIASEATGNVLGGMRSQFVPDARQEDKQKWRSNDS